MVDCYSNTIYSGFGGDKGSRTPDLLNAIQALYQLSYTPEGLVYFSIFKRILQPLLCRFKKFFKICYKNRKRCKKCAYA